MRNPPPPLFRNAVSGFHEFAPAKSHEESRRSRTSHASPWHLRKMVSISRGCRLRKPDAKPGRSEEGRAGFLALLLYPAAASSGQDAAPAREDRPARP